MRLALPLALLCLAAPAASAQAPGGPIPQEPDQTPPDEFIGAPAKPKPLTAPIPPRHPFMAPNGNSNIHDDAYMSDFYSRSGPLGKDTETTSTFQTSDCASVTFDSKGQIVTVCVGLQRPRLKLFDPQTLEEKATMDLPPRDLTGASRLFTDFSGGGYFYLDDQDRAIVPTNDRHLYVVSHATGQFVIERDFDLTAAVGTGDKMISVLPDWSGRIWFASTDGVVGTLDPASGEIRTHQTGEENQNSFSVDDAGGVYIVTVEALYRFEAGPAGEPVVTWREEYPNVGELKPGQASAGSGTTPTVIDDRWVAITDNADPMNVIVYRREKDFAGKREICRQPVFEAGASATDNSLVGAGHSLLVENNYGYEGPSSTSNGGRTSPGLERVDIDRDGVGCRRVWRSEEIAPTVVPKLSLGNGLFYTYTLEPTGDPDDPWYLTAIDFRTGKTVWKRLAGQGLGFNNNYAPVTIGPDGAAYIGVLGGLALIRDKDAPAHPRSSASKLRLTAKRRGRSVRFLVRARSGGVLAPIPNARITLGRRAVTTNSRGRARTKPRLRRARFARATKQGYRAGRVKVRPRR
jgi:hypothetical protein